ncbi:hypothetical protein Bbelb_084610 [Branchiostoma belcheri]|nr:hypothetical protein Bbelb_084610 [Branchiostoma belcheri]
MAEVVFVEATSMLSTCVTAKKTESPDPLRATISDITIARRICSPARRYGTNHLCRRLFKRERHIGQDGEDFRQPITKKRARTRGFSSDYQCFQRNTSHRRSINSNRRAARRAGSREMVWEISEWSVFMEPARTNNDVEGWHSRLKQLGIKHEKLPFYVLVQVLKKEADLVTIQAKVIKDKKLNSK